MFSNLPLFLVGSLLVVFAESQQSSPYDCTFSNEISMNGNVVLMENYFNDEDGTFTMRIRYTGGQSWIGIGINTQDRGKMSPAYAVIGDINRGVKRYDLENDSKDASGVIALEDTNGHLKSGSFVQTTDSSNESILEFTHDLVIRDPNNPNIIEHEINESSVWIYAIGLPNNQWIGKHRVHGAFDGFQLFDGCVKKNESPSFAVDSTTAAPIVVNNEQESTSNGGYGGDSGNANNNEIPTMTTEADSDSDEEYDDDDDDMNDSEDESSDEYTASDVNSINAQQSISFSGSSDTDATAIRGLWIAHGILLSIAWGILAPLAFGAAFLRNNFNVLKTNGRWLQIHFYLSGLVALFTLLGFILAVVATKKKDGSALNFNEDIHHKAGLAIFILVIIQAFAGYFRPSPPPPSSSPDNKVVTNKSSSVCDVPNKNTIDEEVVYNSSGDSESSATTKQSTSSSSVTTSSSKKSYLRFFWECGHRSLGILLLVLAVYNCQTGIILQSENYDQDDKETLTNIFWSITGSITGIIVFLRFVVRL